MHKHILLHYILILSLRIMYFVWSTINLRRLHCAIRAFLFCVCVCVSHSFDGSFQMVFIYTFLRYSFLTIIFIEHNSIFDRTLYFLSLMDIKFEIRYSGWHIWIWSTKQWVFDRIHPFVPQHYRRSIRNNGQYIIQLINYNNYNNRRIIT